METYDESTEVAERINICSSSHRLRVKIEKSFEKVLYDLKPVIEYGFGVYAGFVIGRLFGLCFGNFYLDDFKPEQLDNFSQIPDWEPMLSSFVKAGGFAGAILGVLAIAIINSNLFSQRVVSLYEKEITDPKQIARALYKSTWQTERKVKSLMKKGKIKHKASANADNNNAFI